MSKYEEALRQLNDAQKLAVETIDGPVLVIAGPGTGKTQLLTTRIAHILATTDTLPQNILCLTFTDSAAQTMRERLANMIGQDAYDVTISTYHAYGSDIIRRFPDYFAEQANLQPVDDLGIDRIFRQIITNLPYSNPLKYSDAYLGDIKGLVSDAKRALLSPNDLRAVAKDNLQFIEQANTVVQKTLAGLTRIDKKSTPLFSNLLATAERLMGRWQESRPSLSGARKVTAEILGSDGAFRSVNGLLGHAGTTQPLTKQFKQSLSDALSQVEKSGKTTALTAWKNTWLAKDAEGQFVVDGLKANQKILAAADVYAEYLTELKARELFDYDDMILRAVTALATNNDLRYTLQEQYQYILLDEFQDTNGAQLRLVELLTDNPASEGRPNVLAVGDDDQAIYAFQGANYSHMLQFKDMYRDTLVVPLTTNYRSHPDILHAAGGIAQQINERLHHHFPKINKTLTATYQTINPSFPRRLLGNEGVVRRREARSDVGQYGWVAKQVGQLIEQGVPPGEIAILAPKHKYLQPLVPFLQQSNVPVRYEKRENVLDDPAINQLLRMSELCLALSRGDHQSANALWAQVLSFEFWQLPTSLIWRLSWQTADEDQSWTDNLLADEMLKPIALFFIRLSQLASSETLEVMMDHLIGSAPLDLNEPGHDAFTSPYYQYYFGDLSEGQVNDFWPLLTNLIVLRARLREYRRDNESALTLNDFIEFVEAHHAAELKILNSSPYASNPDAVQLMTAFKAKGMEFTAVFLLAVSDEAWGSKARTQSSRISLPPNLQFIRYAGATNDERLRLLYVAMTRAKSQLYLVNYTQNYAGKHMTRLKYLAETVDDQNEVLSPLLPAAHQRVLPAEDDTPEPTTELAAYWQQRHQAALTNTDMQTLLQDRLRQFQLSPTHVCDFVDLVHCGPQAFFLRTILRFPQAPSTGMQYGNAMHETLEWIHNNTKHTGKIPSQKAIEKTFAARLATKHLSKQNSQLFLERGLASLVAYLAQRVHTIAANNLVEYSFRNEGVFAGQAHLSGKIDKLIIDKTAKEITIVDYKTSKSHNRWTREVSLHKYRWQLYLYKALVEGSHTFAGYRVVDAYLEFVEPDETGNIQELHLAFDEKEYQHIKHLAEVIWRRITTLELPDSSIYKADLTGIEAFETDLLDEWSTHTDLAIREPS